MCEEVRYKAPQTKLKIFFSLAAHLAADTNHLTSLRPKMESAFSGTRV
jgi:hypothetical protein